MTAEGRGLFVAIVSAMYASCNASPTQYPRKSESQTSHSDYFPATVDRADDIIAEATLDAGVPPESSAVTEHDLLNRVTFADGSSDLPRGEVEKLVNTVTLLPEWESAAIQSGYYLVLRVVCGGDAASNALRHRREAEVARQLRKRGVAERFFAAAKLENYQTEVLRSVNSQLPLGECTVVVLAVKAS